MRVLLVDDEPDLLEQAKTFLEKEVDELDINTISSVEGALELLENNNYDCIVSDYQMSGVDGLDFLKTIRDKRESDIPFIMFTGKGREEVAMEVLNLGGNRYLQKGGNPKSQYGVLSKAVVQEIKRHRSKNELKRIIDFEKTISNISTHFVEYVNIGNAIDLSLEKMGNLSGASRVYVFLFRDNMNFMDNVYEWYDEGIEPHIDKLQGLPTENFPWWMEKLENNEIIRVRDIFKMPPEAEEEKKALEILDIKSVLVVPLNTGGELSGFIGFDNCEKAEEWSEFDVELLRIFSNIFSRVLERNSMEKELRESREKYRSLAENTSDILIRIDPEGNFSYISRNVEDEIDYSSEELLGRNISEILTLESYKKAVKRIKKWKDGAKRLNPYEVKVKTKENNITIFELNTSPIFEDGDLEEIQIMARNITERKDIEKKYTFESNLLNSLLNNADDLVYFKDREGRYVRVSKAYASALGLDQKDIEGRTAFDLFPDAQAKEMHEDDLRVMEEGKRVVDREHKVTLSDGVNRWLSTIKVPRYGEVGNITGMVGISRDITERKKAEEKEGFLHSLLQHNVRNKSQIARGYIDLAEEADLPEEVQECLRKSKKAILENIDMIEKVRMLRKIKDGEEKREVFIEPIIDALISEYELQASEKGIEIEFERGLQSAIGGPLLRVLFSNLIENSIKHSRGNRIKISTRGKDECIVSVEDDGKGIPDNMKGKILESGFKSGKFGGSGLGLYLAETIAENYGGHIEVEDSELGGARFDVELKKA